MTINDPHSSSRIGPPSGGVGSTGASKRTSAAGSVTQGARAARDSDGDQDSDNISLSALSRQLHDLSSSSSSSPKVDQISRDYAQGGYAVNAMDTSKGIVRDAALGF
jgi:anti-sigma28 factor (negative regulator of flagellin synthesis)